MKFWIKTLGCKVNQVESAFIVEKLKKEGYILAEREESAQILILNSCAVTEKAFTEALKILRKWSKLHPKFIIFTGCSAQIYADKIKEFGKKWENISFLILGQEQKFRLEEYLKDLKDSFLIDISSPFEKCIPFLLEEFYGHSRAFVKIQDGCSNFCSYCIVPYSRGPSRSLPEEHILKQIEIFLQQGYEEIVLTGIHLGMWGKDLKPPKNLVFLLYQIEKLLEKFNKPLNLRLSSLEINEIDEEFIAYAKESNFLCKHFHIPLQSGANTTLKRMNRKYTAEEYLEKITLLAKLFPKATIGADVIVGFPGEEEKEFIETYQLLEKAPINWLHIFPFSPRPGTPAEKLEPKVPSTEIKKRISLLKELHQKKRKVFLEINLGNIYKTIIEEDSEEYFKGLTDNYIQVFIKKKEDLTLQRGKLIQTKLLHLRGDLVVAEPFKDN